jgi:AAA domain
MRRDNDALHDHTGARSSTASRGRIKLVGLNAFVSTEEEGTEPLVGHGKDANLIPANGIAVFYGRGGAGKTTRIVDLGFSLATGTDWIGFPVPRAVKVLIIEEGPRPLFRHKLGRKLSSWTGPTANLDEQLYIYERPWGKFKFTDEGLREDLAELVNDKQIDVIIVGPIKKIGFRGGGTPDDVETFMQSVDEFRDMCERDVCVIFLHHTNKSGAVSGAWDGEGDTLIRAQRKDRSTTLTVEKARHGERYSGMKITLAWADAESEAEVADASAPQQLASAVDALAERVLELLREHGEMKREEITKTLGLKDRDTGLGNALAKLVKDDKIHKTPRRGYYRLGPKPQQP